MGTNTITIRECPSMLNRIIVYDCRVSPTQMRKVKKSQAIRRKSEFVSCTE